MFMFANPHSNKSNAVACFLAFSSPSGFYVLLSLNFFELFVFLSIFRSLSLCLAIPSPTHACHRRSGRSSLILAAAKNSETEGK